MSTLDAIAIPAEQLAAVAEFVPRHDAMREKFAELGVYMFPDLRPEEFGRSFEKYMLDPAFWGASELTRTGWSRRAIRAELAVLPRQVEIDNFEDDVLHTVEVPASRECHVDLAFVKLARTLTEMPASEAAAERAISIFEFIFDKSRMSSGIDLIQAELMIRFWRINHPGVNPLLDCAIREARPGREEVC